MIKYWVKFSLTNALMECKRAVMRKSGEMSQGKTEGREYVIAFRWLDGALSIPQAFVKVRSRSSAAALCVTVSKQGSIWSTVLYLLFVVELIRNLFTVQCRLLLCIHIIAFRSAALCVGVLSAQTFQIASRSTWLSHFLCLHLN